MPVVYESLAKQTYDSLEWVVVDDGSIDDTQTVMGEIIENSTIPITYGRFNMRAGKCRADNMLLNLATGHFVLWCDSDDSLVPNALEQLYKTWIRISPDRQNEFIGVTAMCADEDGTIQSTGDHPFTPFKTSWGDLDRIHGRSGDMCILIKRAAIGEERFPLHDLVMSESGFWHKFMPMQVICTPDILKIMCRVTENRISGSSKMEYCRGKAYSIIYADSGNFYRRTLRDQFRIARNFHRYCVHGDLSLTERNRLFAGQKTFVFYLSVIAGSLLALKDQILRRVIKTHLVFEQGRAAICTVVRSKPQTQKTATALPQ